MLSALSLVPRPEMDPGERTFAQGGHGHSWRGPFPSVAGPKRRSASASSHVSSLSGLSKTFANTAKETETPTPTKLPKETPSNPKPEPTLSEAPANPADTEAVLSDHHHTPELAHAVLAALLPLVELLGAAPHVQHTGPQASPPLATQHAQPLHKARDHPTLTATSLQNANPAFPSHPADTCPCAHACAGARAHRREVLRMQMEAVAEIAGLEQGDPLLLRLLRMLWRMWCGVPDPVYVWWCVAEEMRAV